MKDISISINKARIKGFNVSFGEGGEPTVTASIGLLTAGDKEITSYTISSEKWYSDEKRFDLPYQITGPILHISELLEKIVTEHCVNSQRLIENTIKTEARES